VRWTVKQRLAGSYCIWWQLLLLHPTAVVAPEEGGGSREQRREGGESRGGKVEGAVGAGWWRLPLSLSFIYRW
jgi:hypothetical protein